MKVVLLIFLCFCLSLISMAQTIDIGEPGTMNILQPDKFVRVTSTKQTKIATYDQLSNKQITDFPKLKPLDLWKLSTDLTGGIRGTIDQPNGYIILSVYGLSQLNTARRGALLYQAKLTNSSPSSYTSVPMAIASPVGSGTVSTSNIKALLQQSDMASGNDVKALINSSNCTYNALGLTIAAFNKDSVANPMQQAPLYACVADENFMEELPIVIQVEIANATLYDVKIPTLGVFNIAKFLTINGRGARDYDQLGKVSLYVNGIKKIDEATIDNQNQVVNGIKLGDKLRIEVKAPTIAFAKDINPTIEGITDRWIARFAGDVQYYCSPNVQPGSYKPWIGFDTRVHYLIIPRRPAEEQKLYPGWSFLSSDGSNITTCSYEWVASMETDSQLEKYAPAYQWPKLDNSTPRQRHNQKEGLNMEILSYYNKNFRINRKDAYEAPTNATQYILGGDEDEITYLNWKNPSTDDISSDALLLKLARTPFKELPEGDNKLSKQTGYPYSGYPVNLMVSAHLRNRVAQDIQTYSDAHPGEALPDYLTYQKKTKAFTNLYDGFEIQDKGTSPKFPDGSATEGITKIPGTISVALNSIYQSISFKTVVTSPLSPAGAKLGFYGCINGVKWPAINGLEAYTLKGLDGLSLDELKKFSIEYAYQNEFGDITKETKYIKDLPNILLIDILSTGKWTNKFVIKSAVYATITAYYNSGSGVQDRVMVGGKELKLVQMRFCGLIKLNDSNPNDELEKLGNGLSIFEEDFRTKPYDRFQVLSKTPSKKELYRSRFGRTYVFKKGDVAVFAAYDADSHTFYKSDDKFYLSSKFESSRVPWDSLDGNKTQRPYLKYYLWKSYNATTPKVELKEGRVGPNLTYTFSELGEFELEINYRDSSSIFHRIIVKDNGKSSNDGMAKKGSIQYRDLTKNEISWLGLNPERSKQLFVAEVKDIYAEYKYRAGPRGSSPDNRWGLARDYADGISWRGKDEADILVNVASVAEVNNYMRTYDQNVRMQWFPNAWDLHFSSNWLKDLPNGLPSYVSNQKVNRIKEPGDLYEFKSQIARLFATRTTVSPWQYILGLISYTDYHGYRVRYNPKCFLDTKAIFDNKTGAFSGNPILPEIPQIASPDYEDAYKDQQEFYYNLKHNRIIVLDKPKGNNLFAAYNAKSGEYIADEPFYLNKNMDNFSVGADISWATEMERDGIRFYDDMGTEKDLFAIMKDKKMNTIRLRVFVDPSDGWSGEKDFLLKARRAADYGFKIMVDIHYSDSFADPGKQVMPKKWEGLSVTQLGDLVYSYTRNLLLKLKALKIPDKNIAWVQVGNETNGGMLASKTKNGTGGWFGYEKNPGEPNGYKNCAFFMNKGYSAVQDVYPDAKVILHLTYKQESYLDEVITNLKNEGLKFDVIGLSLYPADNVWEYAPGYSNQEAIETMNSLIKKHGKAVMAVECGMGYVYDAQCRDFLWDVTNKMKYHIKDGKGLGVNIWEPQASEIYYEGAPIYEKLKFKSYGKGAFKNGRPGIAFDKYASATTKSPDFVRIFLVNNDYKRAGGSWFIRAYNKSSEAVKINFASEKLLEFRYYKTEKKLYFYLSDGMAIDVFQGSEDNKLVQIDGINLRDTKDEDQDRFEFNDDGSIAYKCGNATTPKLITGLGTDTPALYETMDIEGQGIDNYKLPAHLTTFKSGDDLYIVVSAVPHSYKGEQGGTDYLARRFNTGRYVFSQSIKDLSKLTIRLGNLTGFDLPGKEFAIQVKPPKEVTTAFTFLKDSRVECKYMSFEKDNGGTISSDRGAIKSVEFSKGSSMGFLGLSSEFVKNKTGDVVTWLTANDNQYPFLYFSSSKIDMSTYSTFHGLIETSGFQTDNGRTKQIYIRPRLVKNYDDFTLYVDLLELPEKAAKARVAAEEPPSVSDEAHVSVYPNPTQDFLTIDLAKDVTGQVDVLVQNAAGINLYVDKQNLDGKNQLAIKLTELPDGIYFLILKSTDKTVTKRFVVQH